MERVVIIKSRGRRLDENIVFIFIIRFLSF